ncbi:hypothetical protein K503DRAFT_732789 [Rhizopogon vinicolor AM-OR11-026]|uniref:Uncharacterized protein n=1 Tax=Rhizopogon vinicolor AM-OR11-026 TaxID=1314800 RepID=A0A1B7NDM8_9AGAM|nr:hypothetical protein K503DRAFT_732789 [Rhizopogon vinicolor AM-OR11-026]
MNSHFTTVALKFYFTQEPVDTQKDVLEQLTQQEHSVLIETLAAGSLGLPTTPKPVLMVGPEGMLIPILHPSILILTKLKRWIQTYQSTHPKTKSKAWSDRIDIDFLINCMSRKGMKIDFEAYEGKPKAVLLDLIRELHEALREDNGRIDALKSIVNEDDWNFP